MKLKAMAAFAAACIMAFSVTAFAATSASTASVMVTTPGVLQTSTGHIITLNEVDDTTAVNMNTAAAAYVVNTFGPTAQVQTLMLKDVAKPEGYVQGTPISFSWNVSGVAAGDTVLIVHYGPNGMEYVMPNSVRNGVVEFTLTSLSPVSIVKVSAAPVMAVTPEGAAEAVTTGLTLPKTGEADMMAFPAMLAVLAGGVMAAAAKSYKKA